MSKSALLFVGSHGTHATVSTDLTFTFQTVWTKRGLFAATAGYQYAFPHSSDFSEPERVSRQQENDSDTYINVAFHDADGWPVYIRDLGQKAGEDYRLIYEGTGSVEAVGASPKVERYVVDHTPFRLVSMCTSGSYGITEISPMLDEAYEFRFENIDSIFGTSSISSPPSLSPIVERLSDTYTILQGFNGVAPCSADTVYFLTTYDHTRDDVYEVTYRIGKWNVRTGKIDYVDVKNPDGSRMVENQLGLVTYDEYSVRGGFFTFMDISYGTLYQVDIHSGEMMKRVQLDLDRELADSSAYRHPYHYEYASNASRIVVFRKGKRPEDAALTVYDARTVQKIRDVPLSPTLQRMLIYGIDGAWMMHMAVNPYYE